MPDISGWQGVIPGSPPVLELLDPLSVSLVVLGLVVLLPTPVEEPSALVVLELPDSVVALGLVVVSVSPAVGVVPLEVPELVPSSPPPPVESESHAVSPNTAAIPINKALFMVAVKLP